MEFLKTYFRTRGLRQIMQWLIIAAVSISMLSIFAVADAYAASTDIEGLSTAFVPPDAGILDFSSTDTWAAQIYVPDPLGTYYELRGWVWNTNLGWISLYCNGGTNETIPCGPVNYSVKIDTADGKMHGWAWGDNIGWISFSCSGTFNEGSACGAINYAGSVDLTVGPNLGKFSSYAWADTVGWFDLSGVTAKMLPLIIPMSTSETDWGVWTKVENYTAAGAAKDVPPNRTTAPMANGRTGYNIFVHVADISGDIIPPISPDYTFTVETAFTDTVQADQRSSAPENHAANNTGPVQKPNPFVIGPNKTTVTATATPSYYGSVSSSAPTLNCYDGNNDGDCLDADTDYDYKLFGAKATPAVTVPPQDVQYIGARVTITINATLETVTYPGPATYMPSLTFSKLDFKPAVDVSVFDYLVGVERKNYISSTRNTPDYFDVEVQNYDPGAIPTPEVNLNLTSTDANVTYGWIDTLTEAKLPDDIKPFIPLNDFNILTQKIGFPYSSEENPLNPQIPGAAAYSTVDYNLGGLNIKYFSNGVPRTTSEIINQAAVILSGSVYAPGSTQVSTESLITSIGNISEDTLGKTIVPYVKNLVEGAKIKDYEHANVEFKPTVSYTSAGKGRVFYFKNANLHLDDLSWVTATEPITIINDGGDIYVHTNINSPAPGPGTAPGVPVGLIALANNNTKLEAEKGGHIYIDSDVTDLVNVHIYSQGPLFRYTTGVCTFTDKYLTAPTNLVALKEPNFVENNPARCDAATGTYKDPVSSLKNQFYLKGTLATYNCLGCSGEAEPYRGDGKKLIPANANNYAVARLYDLNYLGYFRVTPDMPAGTGARSNSIIAIESAKGLPVGTMMAPIYFDYAPQPTNLLGFNASVN